MRLEYLIAVVFSAALACSVGFLFCFHVYILGWNLSTIEMSVFGKWNPFDLKNFSKNMETIFGDSSWYLPTSPTYRICDGIDYPLYNPDFDL